MFYLEVTLAMSREGREILTVILPIAVALDRSYMERLSEQGRPADDRAGQLPQTVGLDTQGQIC